MPRAMVGPGKKTVEERPVWRSGGPEAAQRGHLGGWLAVDFLQGQVFGNWINPAAARGVRGLFARNERVVSSF